MSLGIAYEPDAGNGLGFTGIQVTHYLGNDSNLCAYVGPSATPAAVHFASAVGQLVLSIQGPDNNIDAVAVRKNSSGGYSLVQDVFGALSGGLVPAGAPYDTSIQPPTSAPSAGATASSASPAPLIPDITSISTVGGGSSGLAVAVGPAAAPPAIVAVTSLENAPPIYGMSVPFSDPNYTLPTPPAFPRSIIRIAMTTTGSGTVALVRGTSDLLAFNVTNSGLGYQFNASAEDPLLGTGTALRGNGNIAFDPANGSRALIGGTTSGGQNVLTLVTGLPGAITENPPLFMPAAINSIIISSNGQYAYVGTNDGLVVVNGVNSTTLTIVPPFEVSPLSPLANAIPYTNCNGTASKMTTVYSVGLSPITVPGSTIDQFLIALGSASGLSCASGYNASLVAFPFNAEGGVTPTPTTAPTPSPSPTGTGPFASPTPAPPAVFVQNNIVAPPAGADLLVVR